MLFKVAEPLVAKAVRRQFGADYGNLKELLESGIATASESPKIQT